MGVYLSINAILQTGGWRNIPPPEFITQNVPSQDCRWGRRRFAPAKTSDLVLPWIALNPSGKVEGGTGRTGKRIFAWSWHWGFDECIVYNVLPFEEPNSKIAHRDFRNRDDEIIANHEYISEKLRDADAVVVAWGNGPKTSIEWAKRLMAMINVGRDKPIATWCLGTNRSKHPKHPSPRAKVPSNKHAEEWISIFDANHPIRNRTTSGASSRNDQSKAPLSNKSEMSYADPASIRGLDKATQVEIIDVPEEFNTSYANKIVRQRMQSIAASSGLNFYCGATQARLDGAPELSNTTRLFRHKFTSIKANILVRNDVFSFDAGLIDAGKWEPYNNAFQNLRTDDPELLDRILDAVEAFAAKRAP